ncbi:MAG: efflux RND transporter periplasmic adaptor subunit [Elusimicrobia bacterium]|jgi:hypothetical protein|nr:efflux RND transporter periplasmic adaptor subunit [Elusimicrobiota bacterium]
MKPFFLILCLVLPLSLQAGKSPQTHEEDGHKDDHGDHADHNEDDKGHEESEGHGGNGEEGHEEGEEEASSSVGPGNAVTATDQENGLQLSPEAVATLDIKTHPAPMESLFPKKAIVTSKDETGVYRLRDGWYKLVQGKTEPQGDRVRFTPHRKQDLRPGDQVVVEGAPLLRVAELDAFSTGEAGHGH